MMKNETTLVIEGQEKKVISEIIDKTIWFKIDEQTYSYDIVELLQSSHTKSKSQEKSLDKIKAPMPGKITKIFVKEGQAVKRGEALVVMEAMKMEYTLKSSIAGKVKKINCKINDQVALAVLLVELESEN